MPWPVALLWGAAALAAGVGAKKGYDAYQDKEKAERIGNRAEELYNNAVADLESDRVKTKERLETLGKFKAEIYKNQISLFVKLYKNNKSKIDVHVNNIDDIEALALSADQLLTGTAATGVAGALAAFGATSATGVGVAASIGGSLMGLSGAAATNATLAWLGGGSLAAGGFGMAGGMVALGGIALAPVLALGGFFLASKAEEMLENARDYRREVDEAIAKMKPIRTDLEAIRKHADEITNQLAYALEVFEENRVTDPNDPKLKYMFKAGNSLIKLLNIPIIFSNGSINPRVNVECIDALSLLK